MAKSKHVYSILIDGDISGLEKSMKAAVKTVADGYDKMASAADKVKHLKDVVGYISQVDNALDVLYHKNPDAFIKAFSGLDDGLKNVMQNLFNIEQKGLTTLDDLGAKINALDGTEGVKAMRKMAEDINSLYEVIGQAPPINMTDGLFDGKGGKDVIQKRIETLKNAYEQFALVWKDVNNQIGKGLQFGELDIGKVVPDPKKSSKNFKQIVKTAVQEYYDAVFDGARQGSKELSSIEDSLKNALSFSDKDFLDITDVFNDLFSGDIEEDDAVKQIVDIVNKVKKAKTELDDALSSPPGTSKTTSGGTSFVSADSITENTKQTITALDYGKQQIVKAWKDYYAAVQDAKNDGYDVVAGEASMGMIKANEAVIDMINQFGTQAENPKYGVAIDLDLSEAIIDEDIMFDDIQAEIDKLFDRHKISFSAPLEAMMPKTAESSQEMISELASVESKTDDLSGSFQELVSYISASGQSPAKFFDKLEVGAQSVDDELQNILQKLNLIDDAGNIKLDSISSGFTNKGGFVADQYTMIARPEKYLPKIQSLQSMLQQAAQDGAQIGTIVDIIRDEKNKLIYEVQNTVSGKAAFSHHKGDINQSVLNATDNQLKDFISTIQALTKNGLFIDWGGDNVLYDAEKGFSVIDLGTLGGQSHTVSLANTVEENVSRFISEMMNFAPSGLKDQVQTVFADKVQKMMNEVLSPSVATAGQSVKASADAVAGLGQETAAHKANAAVIEDENKALQEKVVLQKQAQEMLKSKAQTMTFKDFVTDESLSQLMNTAGLHSLSGMEHFWKQSNYAKQIDFHELKQEEINDILKSLGSYTGADGDLTDILDAKGLGKLSKSWYGFSPDFSVKTIMENMALADDELRNVAMNRLWEIYRDYVDATVSFTDFLNTPFEVWSGDHTQDNKGPAIFNEDQLLSFSFLKSVSKSFASGGGTLLSTMITPKETIGSFNMGVNQAEAELFVPTYAYPAHELYKNDKYRTFQSYYDDQLGNTQEIYDYNPKTGQYEYMYASMQAELDAMLVQLEKQRLEEILGQELSGLVKNASKFSTGFKTGALEQFEKGIIPDVISSNEDYDNDELATQYNQLSDTKKRLVAYYAHINKMAASMPLHIDPKEIGMTGVVGAILNDPVGVKAHTANLTGEAKYNIFGHGVADFISEIYEQNTGPSKTSNVMTEKQKEQAKYSKVVAELEKVKDEAYFGKGYEQLDTLYDFINGISETSQETLDDGFIQNKFTGEVKTVSEIIDMAESIETQYGQNLQFVKDYLQQTYQDIDFSSLTADKQSIDAQQSMQDVIDELFTLKNEADKPFDHWSQLDEIQNYIYGIQVTSQDEIDSGNIKNIFEDDKTITVSELLGMIQDVENQYGENLQFVKDYLQQVYKNALQDYESDYSHIEEAKAEYDDIDSKLNKQYFNALYGSAEESALKRLISAASEIKNTDNETLSQGKYNGTSFADISSLFNQVLEMENQYGMQLDYVKEWLQKIFKDNVTGLDKLDLDNELLLEDDIDTTDLSDITGTKEAAEQELAIEKQITAEKQEQLAIDNVNSQAAAFQEEAAMVENVVQQETTDLVALAAQVQSVEEAIRAKTAAFEAEGTTVSSVVQQEIAELTKLLETLQQITGQVNIVNAGLTNMPTEVPVVEDSPAVDDTKKKTHSKQYYVDDFVKYRTEVENSGYVTDELRSKLIDLDNTLQNISEPDDLEQWNKSLDSFKNEAKKVKDAYVSIEETKAKQIRGEVNSKNLFKGLDFDNTTSNLTQEQSEIIDLKNQLLAQLDAYEAKVKAGEKVELASINATKKALLDKIQLYKQQHDFDTASGKSGAKYGATVFKNITGKVNSLQQTALSDEFKNSTQIQSALQAMQSAYSDLAAKRKEFANIGTLTSAQEAEFDTLKVKVNDTTKALGDLIKESHKLKSQKANADDYVLGDDFVDTDMGRKAALEDFVKTVYPASAAITEFKNNFTEAMFAVDNGDGTITNMTAKFDKARTEIVALAKNTQKVIGPFEAFTTGVWDKLKTLSTYFTASEIIQRTWQAFKEGVQSVREIDSALTELKKVTDETDATYNAFLQDMSKTASVVGSTVKDLTSSAAD